MNPIENNAYQLLMSMANSKKEQFQAKELQQMSGLEPQEINDAVDYLHSIGAVEVIKALGTAPFMFAALFLQSRGRFLYHEIRNKLDSASVQDESFLPARPFNPIGSPYGFTEDDWDTVSIRKEDDSVLYVVLGKQFQSKFYDSGSLDRNIRAHFQDAVQQYNRINNSAKITLEFEALAAGFGEHLFNDIARSIIGSDIAVFESSDLNPNVMLEMGVALTWGIRVLPIKNEGRPNPPSDISGQTWVEHKDSGATILDDKFDRKLVKMIERVMQRKGRSRG